jgi:hypothetical protein
MTNSKMLANLVSIFYQIHSKMLKYISNKKARTLFTEFYVLNLSLRAITSTKQGNTTFAGLKY